MLQLHENLHSQYGVCLWTVLAMLVFLILVTLWVLHLYRQNKREYKFERELEERAKEMKGAANSDLTEGAAVQD